jgi:hypothetical protein
MNLIEELAICEGIDALGLDLSRARERDPAAVKPILAEIRRFERLLGYQRREEPHPRQGV